MDLREYDYIVRRPDTFPGSTLKAVRKVLGSIGSENTALIDKILKDGYIEPPSGYKWNGHYKVILTKQEVSAVLDDLVKAENLVSASPASERAELHYLKQYISYWSRMLHEVPDTYETHKSKQSYYDLRGISFDAFLNLIFDHPVADKAKKEKEWYWKGDNWVELNRAEVVELYVELFSRSNELLKCYSKEQLEQGFWFMMGGLLEFGAYALIHDDELDIALKEKLIGSMYLLYEKFFYDEPLETSSYMWWDAFSHEYCVPGIRDPMNNEEDRRIQDSIFHTLVKTLSLDSEICQGAALHGLGHLRHPETEMVIKDFIKRNGHLTKGQIDYANHCITGDIQ